MEGLLTGDPSEVEFTLIHVLFWIEDDAGRLLMLPEATMERGDGQLGGLGQGL